MLVDKLAFIAIERTHPCSISPVPMRFHNGSRVTANRSLAKTEEKDG